MREDQWDTYFKSYASMHSVQVDSAITDATFALFVQNGRSNIFLIVEFNIS